MEKKRRILSKHFIVLVLFILSQINISCAAPIDPDKIFLKELNRFAALMQSGEGLNPDAMMKSLREMESFSKKYPHNKYSDDAQFIVVVGALVGQWRPEWKESFLAKYSNEKLESETKSKLSGLLGKDIQLPYKLYFEFAEVAEDLKQKDFVRAKSRLVYVQKNMDTTNPNLKEFKGHIEKMILVCNSRLESK